MSNIITIPLTQGFSATINSEDYELVSQFKWYASRIKRCVYAKSTSAPKILLHRLILNVTDKNIKIDHVDHNGLNNTRNNLRIASNNQNMYNARKWRIPTSSKYRGVYWCKSRKVWRVEITTNKIKKYLGKYNNEEDAALAYNIAAIDLHGEFANLNVIEL